MLTPEDVKITPQNIVASCKFNVDFPLEKIAKELGAEFTPEQFPGAIYHMSQGHTFLLFKNGKAVLAGCRSVEQLESAAHDLRKDMKKIGVIIREYNIEVQNMVFSLEMGVDVDLEKFVKKVLDAYYSPELFPGLTYKIHDPNVTFLIFSSGKCVLAGLKDIRDLRKAIEKLVTTVNRSGAAREKDDETKKREAESAAAQVGNGRQEIRLDQPIPASMEYRSIVGKLSESDEPRKRKSKAKSKPGKKKSRPKAKSKLKTTPKAKPKAKPGKKKSKRR
jgi:transcription initiation factor TFIID TATA-box-binding protein